MDKEQGNVFIELAISIPFLLTLLSGVVELGSEMNERAILLRGAQNVARTIVRTKATEISQQPLLLSVATETACNYISEAGLNTEDFSLSISPIGANLTPYEYEGFTPKGMVLNSGTVYLASQVIFQRTNPSNISILNLFSTPNIVRVVFQYEPIIQPGVLPEFQLDFQNLTLDNTVCL